MATQDQAQASGAPQGGSGAFVYLAAGIAAIGGLLFGYDTGVISGAQIFIQKQFALSTFAQELVVSVVLVGAAIGALTGGRFADRFGRRNSLIITSIVFVAGAVASALANSVAVLVAARVVVGLGVGLSSGTVPLYISEVAPAEARGWQVSLFQLAIVVGILVAYLVDYAFQHVTGGWRWMLGLAVVPGAMLGGGMLILPESPRWLVERGLKDRAAAVLRRVRGTSAVDDEIREIEGAVAASGEGGRFADLFSKPVRFALLVGVGLAMFQQVTGINTVIYYAPIIIKSAGIKSNAGAILATAGIGAVNLVMTIVSMWLVDRAGRRPLLLVGIAGMIVSLAVLGAAFHSGAHSTTLAWIAVVTLMAYVASFAISLGPIFWLLIAEIYPLRVRGMAEGVAAGANWAFNLLVSITFLTLLNALGAAWTFWLYAILSIAAWLFSYRLVPETKGRTLEEIEASWGSGRPA